MPLYGFDSQTARLSEGERQLLPQFVEGLKKHKGKQNAITNIAIIDAFLEKKNIKISPARVRKIINHIRIHNMVPGLLANSDGYYVSTDPGEVIMYMSSLEGRIKAIQKVRAAMGGYLQTITRTKQAEIFK